MHNQDIRTGRYMYRSKCLVEFSQVFNMREHWCNFIFLWRTVGNCLALNIAVEKTTKHRTFHQVSLRQLFFSCVNSWRRLTGRNVSFFVVFQLLCWVLKNNNDINHCLKHSNELEWDKELEGFVLKWVYWSTEVIRWIF